MAQRVLPVLLVALSASAQPPAPFDVVAAHGLLASPAGLPSLTKEPRAWAMKDRPGAKAVVVDLKHGYLSWTEDTKVRMVTNELVVLRTATDDVVAVYARVDAPQDGLRAPTVTLRAWRITPSTGALTEEPAALAKLPPLAAFLPRADADRLASLPEEEVTKFVTRVVQVPRGGASARVYYSAFALELDCDAGKKRTAPEWLCRNVHTLKYTFQTAMWDPATASFQPPKPAKAKR